MNTNTMELNLNEMALVSGGRKKFSRIGKPLTDLIHAIVCGHDWKPTGQKRKSNYLGIPLPFEFMEYEESQYMCSKCHKCEWRS